MDFTQSSHKQFLIAAMVGDNKKRSRPEGSDRAQKPRHSNADAGPSKAGPASALRTAPSFVSSLQNDEGDFPRGGGTSLTAFEVKQVREEGRREADAEAAAEVSSPIVSGRSSVKRVFSKLMCFQRAAHDLPRSLSDN